MNNRALHPYYLQQMGIEPWLLRPKAPKARVKLMVMGVGLDCENRLLMNMLKSIDLSPEDVCLFPVDPSSTLDAYLEKIIQIAPWLLFVMGSVPAIDEVKVHYPGIPLIKSHHPVDLVRNPADKKIAYRDLLEAQALLVPSAC